MINLRGVWATFRYEWSCALTKGRIFWWLVLALFPAGIISLYSQNELLSHPAALAIVLFPLVVLIICMMGLLLWATPIVQTELEAQTWGYIAVRPDGKASLLFGKYLLAVVWTASAAGVGMSLSIAMVQPAGAPKMWSLMMGLIALSCMAYAAVFAFLGVVFLKRAMAAAFIYAMMFEFGAAFVPAIINRFTVSYHLRSLCYQGLEIGPVDGIQLFFSQASPWEHLFELFVYTVVFLVAAFALLRIRELATVPKGEG